MKSITREKDPSEIVTRLIPLGYKLKAKDESGKEVETEYRLDISSVNDGKIYIDDELAIATYGIRVKTVEFDDVTVASTLLVKGETWLIENNKISVSYTATALDLSLIGLDADDFEVCNFYPVKNHLLGIDDTIRLVKKGIDICDEIKSTLEFGDNFETLSEALKRKSDTLNLITSNYVTNLRFESFVERTSTIIEQTEEHIRLEVDAQYSDLRETVSQLQVGVNNVTASVTSMDNRVKKAEAKVELKLDKDDDGTIIGLINASADSINISSERLNIHSEIQNEYGRVDEFDIHDSKIYLTHYTEYDTVSSMEIENSMITTKYTAGGELFKMTTLGSDGLSVFDGYSEDGNVTIMTVGFIGDVSSWRYIKFNINTGTFSVESL